jgi:hypothetical protein
MKFIKIKEFQVDYSGVPYSRNGVNIVFNFEFNSEINSLKGLNNDFELLWEISLPSNVSGNVLICNDRFAHFLEDHTNFYDLQTGLFLSKENNVYYFFKDGNRSLYYKLDVEDKILFQDNDRI